MQAAWDMEQIRRQELNGFVHFPLPQRIIYFSFVRYKCGHVLGKPRESTDPVVSWHVNHNVLSSWIKGDHFRQDTRGGGILLNLSFDSTRAGTSAFAAIRSSDHRWAGKAPGTGCSACKL